MNFLSYIYKYSLQIDTCICVFTEGKINNGLYDFKVRNFVVKRNNLYYYEINNCSNQIRNPLFILTTRNVLDKKYTCICPPCCNIEKG